MRPYLHFRLALETLVCFLAFAETTEARTAVTTSSTGVLSSNRDTVFGVYDEFFISEAAAWQTTEAVTVKNNTGKEVVLDSFSLRPDSSIRSDRLYFYFSVKSAAGTLIGSYRPANFGIGQTQALKPSLHIPAHDSVIFGHFGIDVLLRIEKESAFAIRYRAGDSIATPLAFFSGKDSVKFQLRAKVMPGVFYHPVTIRRSGNIIQSISISHEFLLNGRIQLKSSKRGNLFSRRSKSGTIFD